jgi:sarcosine oxidase subunit alpha
MPDECRLRVNGREVVVPSDVSVIAALMTAGVVALRRSVTGEPRGPLCGMGVCHECRVTIDGVSHRRACMETVRTGMDIEAGSGE